MSEAYARSSAGAGGTTATRRAPVTPLTPAPGSREPGGDIYPPGEESTYLFASADGEAWTQALKYRRLSSADNARIDVYWALPSGELVLEMHNVVQGDPATGKGYQLLRPVRR